MQKRPDVLLELALLALRKVRSLATRPVSLHLSPYHRQCNGMHQRIDSGSGEYRGLPSAFVYFHVLSSLS